MKVIYDGRLKNGKPFTVMKLTEKQLNDILTLQQYVYERLAQKEILEKLTVDEFRYILEGNGLIIGVIVDDTLIGIRALLVPPIDENHLGIAVGLQEEELEKVIYQEISFIHPSYRGNRLQQLLAKLIMEELNKTEHPYRYVCCTVAPFNIPSLKDKFNQKMQVKALKTIYDGKLRYIFMKDLKTTDEQQWQETKEVAMDDISLQQQLLQAGWFGYQLIDRNEQYFIRFGKKKKS